MSDLREQRSDQDDRAKPRIGPGNRLRRDRELRPPDRIFLRFATLSVLAFSCVTAPPPVLRAPQVHRSEVWVDAFSPAGGDGTSARPFKSVPKPVPGDVTIHLRAGLYSGPFLLGEGAQLEGHGEVVLTGEAGQTVVTATAATLQGVSVQGGAIGLEAGADVVLSQVHFSGQRKQAALVHGKLTLTGATFEASVEGIDGVAVDRGAMLELSQAKFTGGFRRAVLTEGGTLVLDDVTGEGPKTLVHALGATSRLSRLHSRLGSGPALVFSAGTVELREAELLGHEYSALLISGVEAKLSEVKASGALQACISAINSALLVSKSTLTRCGPGGAVTLQNAKTTLRNVEIDSSLELGVFVKMGTLVLDEVKISKVTAAPDGSSGDGFHVRGEAQVSAVGPVAVVDVEGTGLFVSTYSQVTLPRLIVERARSSALFVERGAKVNLEALLVRGGSGPAIVVPDKASVEVKSLSVAGGNELPVYAECSEGAEVTIGRLESTVQQLPSRCVSVK
jgi:hypothetical protein